VKWFELDHPAAGDATLRAAVASASIIYNFAGSSGAAASNRDPLHSLEENCRVQLAFLAACEKAGHKPHVVFPSSWLVYAPGGPDAVDEDHPVGPLSMYGAHKLCIEHYLQIFARQDRITYTICRISNPYGFDAGKTNSRYKILNSFIQLALAKKPIRLFGDGRQLRDFIYIDDLIEIFSRCGTCSAARNQIFNVSSGHSYSLLQAVEKIMRLLGPSPVLFEPWPDEYRAVEPGDYVADIARATRLLDFRPAYDLESGLLQTAREYRNENKILVHSSGG
jgi:dTDP-glucose 4,6-dehydratase/UDP-glucose 4-epimerase